MVKPLAIAALAVATTLMPAALARPQSRRSPAHAGYGTRHAQRHYHYSWRFVVPHYDRHDHGTYYLDGGVNYYVPRTQRDLRSEKPIRIEFGGYEYMDDLSARLERFANELCLELYYNYRHNRGFAETYREAYRILETAKYIHAKEHQADRAEVARRLNEVDGLFHHVQEDVSRWSRRQVRQIGQGGAQTKVEMVGATLHHSMNDVGVKGTHGEPETAAATVESEAAPPPAPVSVPRPAR